jgi:hypothetical protein
VIAMREDYITNLPEREFYDPTIKEELDSLYDEVSTTDTEDEWTEDN